ncbi:MAG TPA: hypothetical protein VJK54_09885 [Chthoniobacterales bacterium]|nr:hypothetical protein [Chthoniobacterales bacterium]
MRHSLLIPLLLLSLSITGCSNLTPVENALIAAGAAGTAAGVALGVPGVSPGITIPVALGAAALAGGGTYLYAKNRATIDQRRIAEARARLYYANLNAQQQQQTGRYLAVNAPNSSKNQGQAVMLYDTQTCKTANNNVYEIKKPPAFGQQACLGNTSATYIGSGN